MEADGEMDQVIGLVRFQELRRDLNVRVLGKKQNLDVLGARQVDTLLAGY